MAKVCHDKTLEFVPPCIATIRDTSPTNFNTRQMNTRLMVTTYVHTTQQERGSCERFKHRKHRGHSEPQKSHPRIVRSSIRSSATPPDHAMVFSRRHKRQFAPACFSSGLKVIAFTGSIFDVVLTLRAPYAPLDAAFSVVLFDHPLVQTPKEEPLPTNSVSNTLQVGVNDDRRNLGRHADRVCSLQEWNSLLVLTLRTFEMQGCELQFTTVYSNNLQTANETQSVEHRLIHPAGEARNVLEKRFEPKLCRDRSSGKAHPHVNTNLCRGSR